LHYVYILESKDGKYYTGYTVDLDRRMKMHAEGKGSKFVRAFGFKKLLYVEKFHTKSHAMQREAEIKKWPRTRKKELIRGKVETV
jgi:putative endonuclease